MLSTLQISCRRIYPCLGAKGQAKYVAIGCGHLLYCETCMLTIANNFHSNAFRNCTVCRTPVERYALILTKETYGLPDFHHDELDPVDAADMDHIDAQILNVVPDGYHNYPDRVKHTRLNFPGKYARTYWTGYFRNNQTLHAFIVHADIMKERDQRRLQQISNHELHHGVVMDYYRASPRRYDYTSGNLA